MPASFAKPPALRALLASAEPPLDLAVALLAAEEDPSADPAAMLAALDALAAGVFVPEGASPIEGLARLCHHLYAELGFRGDEDDYDAPDNSLLHRVLERRRGLPILLSVVAIEVGRRVGVVLDGIGFPGHFLVQLRGAEPRFFVDPFRGGQVLREDSLRLRLTQQRGQPVGGADWARAVATVDTTAILLRMTNNLKGATFRRGDYLGTLRQVDRLLLLDPEDAENYRDRGWLLVRLGRGLEAIPDYQRYLAARPDADDAADIRADLARLVAAAVSVPEA